MKQSRSRHILAFWYALVLLEKGQTDTDSTGVKRGAFNLLLFKQFLCNVAFCDLQSF